MKLHMSRLWLHSGVFAGILLILYMGYLYLIGSGNFGRNINLALAGVSIICISVSLVLSGITYFFDFADRYIVFRKYLGIWGFVLALSHSFYTLYRMGSLDNVVSYFISQPPTLLFALACLQLLLLLTIISHVSAARVLGNIWWRRLLRLAYVALFLGTLHYATIRINGWKLYIETGLDGLPPPSLILLIIVLATFGIRILLGLKLRK